MSDNPPFHAINNSGEPVIRVTIVLPGRNAAMDVKTQAGMDLLAGLIYEGVVAVANYGVLPNEPRYFQIDIPEDEMSSHVDARRST